MHAASATPTSTGSAIYRNKADDRAANSRVWPRLHHPLRPALVFGRGDILINNIAFFLRHVPVFTIFGAATIGRSRSTDAFASFATDAVDGNYCGEAVAVAGPDDWRFLDLVRAVRSAVRSRALLVRAPAALALAGLGVAGVFLRDVVLTSDEVKGLTREYLYVDRPVRSGPSLGEWLARQDVRATLGRRYESELARHFR